MSRKFNFLEQSNSVRKLLSVCQDIVDSGVLNEDILLTNKLERALSVFEDAVTACWHIDDVRSLDGAEKLTDEQARTVLASMSSRHDANQGFNWDTLQFSLDFFKKKFLESSTKKSLEIEPEDVEPCANVWFEDGCGWDTEESKQQNLTLFLNELSQHRLVLQHGSGLLNEYAGMFVPDGDEVSFFLGLEKILNDKYGFYTYNSDTRFEVYDPVDAQDFQLECFG